MSWKCRLIEKEDIPNAVFGDMWFAPWMDGFKKSPEYESMHRGKRPALVVFVPPGLGFCVDNKADNMGGHGWTVTGEAPNITVSPSIGIRNAKDRTKFDYHGWLKEGELSDDIEGKKY